MSNRTLPLDDKLYDYLLAISLREPEILIRLREETAALPEHNMQIAPEQGRFMALLVELIGAQQIVEVGTFTGYSALSMALAMPEDGRLVCCDISAEWTAIARRYWHEAHVNEKIELRLAPALETLTELLADGGAESFDMAFIDADKTNYLHYYEACLQLLRRGGLLVVDNVLWSGAVIDEQDKSPDTQAIRAFNRALQRDTRIGLSVLPIADGLTLGIKR